MSRRTSVQTGRARFTGPEDDCSVIIDYSEYSLSDKDFPDGTDDSLISGSSSSLDRMNDEENGGGRPGGGRKKTQREIDLEKRVTDLENQVSALNDEIANLKFALAAYSAAARAHEPLTNGHVSNASKPPLPQRANKSFTKAGYTAEKPPAPVRTPGRTPSTSGRKYVQAATKRTPSERSLRPGVSKESLIRTPSQSTGALNNGWRSTESLSRGRSTENLSMSRSNLAIKKIGGGENAVDKAPIRFKVQPEEAQAKLFLKGRAVTMFGPVEFTQGRVEAVGAEPAEELVPEWVFGYRGKDCRNNLLVVSTGEVAYFVAAIAVLYNPRDMTQRHYTQHTHDIKSIALHPDTITVATGQMGNELKGPAHVRVWNGLTLETLAVLGEDFFVKSVSCIAFSKWDSGARLVAVDDGPEHILSLWNWETNTIVDEIKASNDPVIILEYHPSIDLIVGAGKQAIFFFNIVPSSDDQNDRIIKKTGIFEKQEKPKFITAVAFTPNGSAISGDSLGNIIIWDIETCRIEQALDRVLEGPISSIYPDSNDGYLVGGIDSPTILEFDCDFNRIGVIDGIVEVVGGIRVITIDNNGTMFVGTTKNCILTSEPDYDSFNFAMMSHNRDLWGLTIDMSSGTFLTCGADKLIVLWNRRQAEWYKQVEYACISAAFHPFYPIVAVGTENGRWFVVHLNTQEIITIHTDSKEQFNVLSFSPDGKWLAAGCQDKGTYIYRIHDGQRFSKVGKCIGHTSYVAHIDWSADSNVLRTNSGDFEILFWNPLRCKQITNPDHTRNLEWYTHTCVLDYSVLGIWPEGADGSDINSVDRSIDQNLLVTADDNAMVKLFNYPTYIPKASFKVGQGHSSHVSKVRFLPDGRSVVSTGDIDNAIVIWAIQ